MKIYDLHYLCYENALSKVQQTIKMQENLNWHDYHHGRQRFTLEITNSCNQEYDDFTIKSKQIQVFD